MFKTMQFRCNSGGNVTSTFFNVGSSHEIVNVEQRNTSCDTNDLVWKLNLEMRHAVLPVTIFVSVEAFVGFLGNILVLYIFLFRYHVSNFRYFVLCLAFIDFVSTVTTMPGEVVTQLYWYVYPVPIFCKIKSFFNVFTVTAEAMCLFALAVDRYRKVCTPFSTQIKPSTAKKLCFMIYLTAFVIALPAAVLWGTNTHQKIYENEVISVTLCEKDENFVRTDYPVIYVITIQTAVAVCLLLMLVLYIFVTKKLLVCRTKRGLISASGMNHSPTNTTRVCANCKQQDICVTGEICPHVAELPSISECPSGSQGVKISNLIHVLPYGLHKEAEVPTTENRTSTVKDEPVDSRGQQHIPASPTRQRGASATRVRKKTLIMFILTVVFITTTILYLTLLAMIARTDDILQEMSDSSKAAYFFFFRLVFINHVINPFIYGFLDTEFIHGLGELRRNFLSFYRVRIRPW